MIKPTTYRHISLLLALCLCLVLNASAQQKSSIVKGVIFKKNSPVTIGFTTVTNITRKSADVLSNELGGFSIEASLGDTLLFRKADYAPQTLIVLNYLDQTVYMQQAIQLNQVTIKETSKKAELLEALENYKKKGQYNSLHPGVMSVISSPISGLYDLFGKAPSQARKFQKFSQQELERIEISKRYNRAVVQKTVKIAEEDLETFMINFQPAFEDIKVWSDYDIITYIKKCFAHFEANKANYKLQKLY